MHAHPTRTLLVLLGLVILCIGFAYGAFKLSGRILGPAQSTSQINGLPENVPPPQPKDYVSAQHGFQYLVSYTDSGFSPKTLSVNKGETVRFTDNANNSLRLLFESAQITALNHGEYYEYTFANMGTFTYSDGANNKVAITVK